MLARKGFTDPSAAEQLLAAAGRDAVDAADTLVLVDALAESADPDLALGGLARLRERAPDSDELMRALREDVELRGRLIAVLGASEALGRQLSRHPAHWRDLRTNALDRERRTSEVLRGELVAAVGADAAAEEPRATASGASALDALRVAYHRRLLGLAARDLVAAVAVEDVGIELADLAAAALEAALAIARAELPDDAARCRLAVIGLGKCGGGELNYVSDVDVVFVAEPAGEDVDEQSALRTATRLAAGLMRACSTTTGEGALWPVDAALRPEGRNGPLVRTVASHSAYYERWARTWEFQALLKARVVAGDRELGQRYLETVTPLVWTAASRPNFVADVQAMRRRVEQQLPPTEADRQLKLGPGGLRDVEFAVQLLQLVHGRTDHTLRGGATLSALSALAAGGYVGRDDAAELDAAYRFLRALEHRMQLHRLRRTQVVPEDAGELRRLGRTLGLRTDPVKELQAARGRHARDVRRLHEKLFYRPLLLAVSRLAPDEARLTAEAARQRLEALGYADPAGALRHLEALTTGVTRRAAIQRTLLPVMLGWFADAARPDAGLLAFRQVSEALGTTHWYLRLLRDEGAAAQRLARLLATSQLATDLLLRAPDAVTMLGADDELRPRPRAAMAAEVAAAVGRHDDPEEAVRAVRGIRRRELFRIAAADVLGRLDVPAVGEALTDITAATMAGALDVATLAVAREHGGACPARLLVVAMGSFGGYELGYGSDADVLFVYEPVDGAEETIAGRAAHAVAGELRRLLALPAADPPLVIDPDLRPEGRGGPLVRTLAAYGAYYARWSAPWESQALLRARPVAGDEELATRWNDLADSVRFPAEGLTSAQLRELRRIKARVEAERLPRGVDSWAHTKLGPGGLADVEWTAQLLQLRHGARLPGLRTTRTLPALGAAAAAGLLTEGDAQTLARAWRLAARARNALMLVRGRASDTLPADRGELAGLARALDYSPGKAGSFLDDYRRSTRRARAVMEKVFFE